MASTRSRPDYDGPTINGRPILVIEEVQTWFLRAGCTIPEYAAAPIAQDLNHCAFLSREWKSTPELRAARRKSKSLLAMQRIYRAMRSLQNDLPILIHNTLQVHGSSRPPALEPIEALLEIVNRLEPGFRKYAPRGRGREPDLWHKIARNVGQKIADTYEKHSGRRPGLGKPTSPAIKILESALAYLDENHSAEAMLTERLDQHRGRGHQQIVAKHVTVNADQAMVAESIVAGNVPRKETSLLTATGADSPMQILEPTQKEAAPTGGGTKAK
jgi:hypothetical protein